MIFIVRIVDTKDFYVEDVSTICVTTNINLAEEAFEKAKSRIDLFKHIEMVSIQEDSLNLDGLVFNDINTLEYQG